MLDLTNRSDRDPEDIRALDVETYDAQEVAAIDRLPIRIIQAFFPEMFAAVGYPARVQRAGQLWRFIDVMHETRTRFNMDEILHGLTNHEFELFQQVTRIVDRHATQAYGRHAHATAALLRAIHVLRLIKLVTGDERPAVLEIGPGCGYLAMLLVMEGYPYIGTDVAQAFYLYQNRMLSQVAKNLRELVEEDADLLSLDTPKPGTAIHIPWWKWVTLTPEKVTLSAGIMTSNHCLCEMHPNSVAYLAMMARRILSNHPGGGKFVFEGWGYDLLHSQHSVLAKFVEHGFRLCHNEDTVSAMALADHVAGWRVYGSRAVLSIMRIPIVPIEENKVIDTLNRRPRLKRSLSAAINRFPRLKRFLVRRISPALAPAEASAARGNADLRVAAFKSSNPLSQRLSQGRRAVIAQADIRLPEVEGFLRSHFADRVPQQPDEIFFQLIGTKS
jgi:hypothetical protein